MTGGIGPDNGAQISIASVPASIFRTTFSHILNMGVFVETEIIEKVGGSSNSEDSLNIE